MLGTCQHLKEAHKDTTSAWAATVTATTGVAESKMVSGTETGEHFWGFTHPAALSCRAGGSQGAAGVRVPFRLCRLWGGGCPCSALGKGSAPDPAPCRGEPCRFHFVAGGTRGCFTSQCRFKRPRMAHDLPSHIPWGVCVFSLSHFLRVTELF